MIEKIQNWFINLVKDAFAAIWGLIKDALIWAWDQLLTLLVYIVNQLDFDFSVFNPGTYISQLPADITNIIALIRIPESVAIVLSAIVIRLLLQLIPFVRLGS